MMSKTHKSPDGLRTMLMSKIAKRIGLPSTSTSTMHEYKAAYKELIGPVSRGDEGKIVEWAWYEYKKHGRVPRIPQKHEARKQPIDRMTAIAKFMALCVKVEKTLGINVTISFHK